MRDVAWCGMVQGVCMYVHVYGVLDCLCVPRLVASLSRSIRASHLHSLALGGGGTGGGTL